MRRTVLGLVFVLAACTAHAQNLPEVQAPPQTAGAKKQTSDGAWELPKLDLPRAVPAADFYPDVARRQGLEGRVLALERLRGLCTMATGIRVLPGSQRTVR
jgi:hypothetical protein